MIRILIGTLLIVGCVMPPADAVFLVGATVYDGRGGVVIEDAVIRVEEGRIVCVGSEEECPVGEGEVVDLTGRFVAPGLVDAHVHFLQTGWLDGRPDSPLVVLAEDPGEDVRAFRSIIRVMREGVLHDIEALAGR